MMIMRYFILGAVLTTVVGVGMGQEKQDEPSEQSDRLTTKQRMILERRVEPVTLSEKLLDICKHKTTTKGEVESLILEGANVLYRDDKGVSPLMSALFYIKDPAVIETLLVAGAEVNIKTSYSEYTPLHIAAYGRQDYEVFKLLIEANANVRAHQKNGMNVFHILMDENKPSADVVSLLVDAGANVDELGGYDDAQSPLLLTTKYNPNIEVIQKLISADANINEKGEHGKTPLIFALEAGASAQVIKYLLDAGADVQATKLGDSTPLHFAAKYADSVDVIDTLLEYGANLHAISWQGETPLFWATQRWDPSVDITQKLIDAGADVNMESTSGYSPIHFAAKRGSPSLVLLLVNAGANVNAHSGYRNATPLLLAAEDNDDPIVLLTLLHAGADIKATNSKGQTALMLIYQGYSDGDQLIVEQKREILLNAGALTHATCNEGKTAADYDEYAKASAERLKNGFICGGVQFIHIREFE